MRGMFKKTRTISGHFKRNTVVSVLSFIIDYSVFLALRPLFGGLMAIVIGYSSGLILNFILSVAWAFNEKRFKNTFQQFTLFSAGALSGLVIELIVFSLLRSLLPVLPARLLSTGCAFIWNFVLKELFIFRRKRAVTFRQIMGAYNRLSINEKLYLLARWATCPIEKIINFLPSNGTVYEYGCGSGINLVVAGLLRPNLQLHGSDIDPRKLSLAHKINLPQISIDTDLPKEPAHAFLIVDVLYLLDDELQPKFLTQALSSIHDDGMVLIKEMSERKKWRFRWNSLQEHISTHITKMTASSSQTINVMSVERINRWAVSQNLKTEMHFIGQRYIHPHALIKIVKL